MDAEATNATGEAARRGKEAPIGGTPATGDVMTGEKVSEGAESVVPCPDAAASLDGMSVIRIDDGHAAKPEVLKASEAVGMGSREPDAEVGAAVERLAGRFVYRFAKRAFDIVFRVAVPVLLRWMFLIVAIAIKVDDPKGPVFFGQERVGKDGKRFRMWKFRSMVSDAEARLEGLQTKNEKTGPVFKMKDDPRVTRVGRFIRKTSIDELPQFLNVFLGQMSVVGPRPALPKEVATYTPRQQQRLLVKPGMTCYWQTRRNRDAITFDEWVELDLLYIKKCSAWSDFKLIVQTVGVVLTAQGS